MTESEIRTDAAEACKKHLEHQAQQAEREYAALQQKKSSYISLKDLALEEARSKIRRDEATRLAELRLLQESANPFLGLTSDEESVKQRGQAFIEAARMIVNNHPFVESDAATIKALKEARVRILGIEKGWEVLHYNEEEPNRYDDEALQNLLTNLGYVLPIKKAFHELTHAENHVNWHSRKPITTVITLGSGITQVRIDEPITKLTQEQTQSWLSILKQNPKERPKWFQKLAPWEQNFLRKRILAWQRLDPREPNLGDYLGVPPTTIRGYPGARNGYISHILTYTQDPKTQEVKLSSKISKIRSGHVSPSEMQDDSERIVDTVKNVEQLILSDIQNKINQEQPGSGGKKDFLVHLQTLITPYPMPTDFKMNRDRLIAIELLRKKFKGDGFKKFLQANGVDLKGYEPTITLLTSNHPVNFFRTDSNLFLPFAFLRDPKNTWTHMVENRNTLRTLKQKAKESKNATALAALEKIDSIGFLNRVSHFFFSTINLDAERAALEQIAAMELGIRIGSCMSGKDREGGVSQHVAAMSAFYAKHKHFPPFPPCNAQEKKEREEYQCMVAQQFLSCHDKRLAVASAPGAAGLKESATILGGGVVREINRLTKSFAQSSSRDTDKRHWEKVKAHEHSDKLASRNRVSTKKKTHPELLKTVKPSDDMTDLATIEAAAAKSMPAIPMTPEYTPEPSPRPAMTPLADSRTAPPIIPSVVGPPPRSPEESPTFPPRP